MKDILSSLETEYAFAALDPEGKRVPLRLVLKLFDQAVVALNDLTAELVEQSARRFYPLTPYIGSH